ncbi:hypothetical protein [Burkholderia sp. Tr-862]|uniref:hypothetical protein n=1 Tax=Burkholderia sp. Tr-862 TaxID=2608331 RepID=UPI001454BAEA|nr:hypothetical protein [Burkholderia sp. Tr-862]
MKRDLHFVSAIGPATRDQLEQLAVAHDRMWDRKTWGRRIVFGVGFSGLTLLTGAVLVHQFNATSQAISGHHWWDSGPALNGVMVGFVQVVVCLLAIYQWDRLIRPISRPVNPYRPIDVAPAELEADERNAACPAALAYLDAIRHQRRSIVPHDLDVLAMVRQQQQSHEGA